MTTFSQVSGEKSESYFAIFQTRFKSHISNGLNHIFTLLSRPSFTYNSKIPFIW